MSAQKDPAGPHPLVSALPIGQQQLLAEAARSLPSRAEAALTRPRHRALGRVVRDAVLLLLPGRAAHGVPDAQLSEAAIAALERLTALQGPSGTFHGGDNVDSPPDSAFTLNDLAWARTVPGSPASLAPALDRLLEAATPALVAGGVHTPNHRWELASTLCRLWEAHGLPSSRARAEEWLCEGVDLQPDGMFSERSANYAAHVSIPSLTTMARILERPDLQAAADLATRSQAELTDVRGRVETLASRRQDQFEPFDGGALHPWFRHHAARTGDPLTARAAERTGDLADTDAVLTFAALAAEDPSALDPLPDPSGEPTPEAPEVVALAESGLMRIDHGTSSAVLFGGTDTAQLGRIASGASSRPTFARFHGRSVGIREMRMSRDFFSVGPLRPGPPEPDTAQADTASAGSSSPAAPLHYVLREETGAEYFQPLPAAERDAEGRYELEFNGRFAAAMTFTRRPAERVTLRTSMRASATAGELRLHWEFDGPATAVCLLLALDGSELTPTLQRDEQGRHLLEPGPEGTTRMRRARCVLSAHEEQLEISAHGALGGRAFYDPGEAYTFLGASDEPAGETLLVPASTCSPLTLHLRLRP